MAKFFEIPSRNISSGVGNFGGEEEKAPDQLNPSDAYSQSLDYLSKIDDNQRSNLKKREQDVVDTASGAYQRKVNTDSALRDRDRFLASSDSTGKIGAAQASNSANVMEQNRLNRQYEDSKNNRLGLDPNGNVQGFRGQLDKVSPGGSGAEAFGLGAAAPSGYTTNAFGQRSLYDGSSVADWQNRQNKVLSEQVQQARELAAIKTDNQRSLDNNTNRNQIELQNRQNVDNRTLQGDKNRTDERIATTQAQGGVFSSLLGSVGSGSQNYRFW
jgi:hypothetical protein